MTKSHINSNFKGRVLQNLEAIQNVVKPPSFREGLRVCVRILGHANSSERCEEMAALRVSCSAVSPDTARGLTDIFSWRRRPFAKRQKIGQTNGNSSFKPCHVHTLYVTGSVQCWYSFDSPCSSGNQTFIIFLF